MSEQSIEYVMELARDMAATCFGHDLSRFDTCGDRRASAECIRPGCNMGLTVDMDVPGYTYAIIGACVSLHCASPERPLRAPGTLMYLVNPSEGIQ